jgi:hypothetical protein
MKSDHVYALLEEMNGKFDFIVEVVQEMRLNMVWKAEFDEFRREMRQEHEIFRAVAKDISKMVAKHEKRITVLEKA